MRLNDNAYCIALRYTTASRQPFKNQAKSGLPFPRQPNTHTALSPRINRRAVSQKLSGEGMTTFRSR